MKLIQWNISRPSDKLSGVGRYERELYDHMHKLFPDIQLVNFPRKPGRLAGNIPVTWVLRPNLKGADLVHATFQTFAPVVYLAKPRRFVVTVQDLIPMLYPSTIRDFSTRIQWKFTPSALRKVDHIIAISEFVKKEIVRILNISPEKITVVYDGVDHALYRPMKRTDCLKKFGLDPAYKYLLVVASNEHHKRLDLAASVFQEVQKHRPDVRLIKIGYGQLLQGKDIINPGWVDESDMGILFNCASVYLHTAEYEGFGLPILEAMACGTPVVVSNKASIPEIVGQQGDLINIDSPDCLSQFSAAVLRKIDVDRDLEAVKRSDLFQWDNTARDTFQVYRKLL